jgi:diacylglycerol O-acyltransferase
VTIEGSVVADRLSPLDVSFLYLETPATPMHVGSVAVLEPPPDGLDYEGLVALIGRRVALVPRYRQKVRVVPGHLANPVWVDDEDFDLTYHVRRSALPRPGTDAQLRALVARLQSRPLDRSRPLWEVYLVEGLHGGRIGLVTKTHQAMVDGVAAVDLTTVLLDVSPIPADLPDDDWTPVPEPGALGLLTGAVGEYLRRPASALDAARSAVLDVRTTAGRVAGTAIGVLSSVRTVAQPAPDTPLNAPVGQQRRFATVRTDLADYRRIRAAHDGTVNDVVLAVVAGALRAWLLTRAEPVSRGATVRALVPLSVRPDDEPAQRGNRVSSYLVDLPVGEGSPVMRLHQVSFAMRAHKESGRAVGADTLAQLAGFAPPTLHALGARVASGMARRLVNLVVTNVPGPQLPLYAGGARMLEMFPVVPLSSGHAVAVGVTSYDGGVYYGVNADRNALPDVEVLAGCIEESLAELLGTVRA